MNADFHRRQLAREAKAIVAVAFRNGPIEDIHAGGPCPTCTGQAGYSRITDAESKDQRNMNLAFGWGNGTRPNGMSRGCRETAERDRGLRVRHLFRRLFATGAILLSWPNGAR
jgi:hypothetical protein